jgi:hypothetical protein
MLPGSGPITGYCATFRRRLAAVCSEQPGIMQAGFSRVRTNRKAGLPGVRLQMVDFGSGQGLNVFETGRIVSYSEDFEKVKTPPWTKRCRLWMGAT